MDIVFIALVGLFWLAAVGLARGCRRLQGGGARP